LDVHPAGGGAQRADGPRLQRQPCAELGLPAGRVRARRRDRAGLRPGGAVRGGRAPHRRRRGAVHPDPARPRDVGGGAAVWRRRGDGGPVSGRVGVVGAGLMGGGVAYVAAAAGYEVVLVDRDPARLEAVPDRFRQSWRLQRLAGRGPRPADVDRLLDAVSTSGRLDDVAGADPLVEDGTEGLAGKTAPSRPPGGGGRAAGGPGAPTTAPPPRPPPTG